MRIAVWHNLPSGGGKRALYHHLRGLKERGHEVETWCPDSADEVYLPLAEFGPVHVLPLPKVDAQGFSWGLGRSPWRYRNTVGTIRALDEHAQACAASINRGGFDVLLANSCRIMAAPHIGRYCAIPSVLYLQEPKRRLYEARPTLPWAAADSSGAGMSLRVWRHLVSNLLEVHALRIQLREESRNAAAFDLLLVNSLFSRESIARAYGLDAKVCYLGIDTELFCPPRGVAREAYVVGLGEVSYGKGVDRAIHAVASIETKRRPRLLWIGNREVPDYSTRMRELARTTDVALEILIGLDDRELVCRLSAASVMIYTSRLEPFGFAPLEANACEVPVVAIAEGGVRETVREGVNGTLISGDDSNALGAALEMYLGSPELRSQMGHKAREYAQREWTWPQAVQNLEAHLVSVASRPRYPRATVTVTS